MGLILLTGMPGAGKTTIGSLLAQRLGWKFMDLDDEVEQCAQKTISEIFADEGEAHFRHLESATLADLLKESDCVVALGGGTIESSQNLEQVQRHDGTLIYLKAELDLLVARNKVVTDRPLLPNSHDAMSLRIRLQELLARREQNYLSATIIVEEDSAHSPEEVASYIIALLRQHERV